ncbi:hypothetical protein D3C79_497360 [compost metagenome]
MIDHADIGRHVGRHVRADQQQMIRLAQALDAVEQHRQVLFPRAATGIDQQAAAVGNAQFGAQVRVAALGIEGLQVDAQALHMHVAHAQAAQFVGHHLAGRQDPVEIAVQLADVGLDIGGEPIAHAIADQQRQVGVVKADDRHIKLAPSLQRGPGSQIRVADFDQVWREAAQHVAPGRQPYRKTIAVAEGQGRRWHLVDAIGVLRAGAGNQQAVAHALESVQAAVFGIKISTYAAAGRGVEHGDVSNVHDQHPSGIVFGSVIWR